MIERGAPVNQAQEEGQREGSGYRLHPTLPAQLSEGTPCRYGYTAESCFLRGWSVTFSLVFP